MGSYKTSDGERLDKSTIDYRVREAKKKKVNNQLEEHGYNFCEECNVSSGTYLDCSHTESVKSCQDNGRSEKAYNIENIMILCRTCHKAHDGLDLRF